MPPSTTEAVAEAAAVEESAASEPAATPRRWRRLLLPGLAGILVAALVAACGVFAWLDRSYSEKQALRQRFVDTAEQAVVNMTTLHGDTAGSDIQRLYDLSSGTLRDQVGQERRQAVQVAQSNKLDADGRVAAAGIETETGDDATVLVAAVITVKNVDLAQPQQRVVRFRVGVHEADGSITATKMEVLP
jgi:Mce-associated membrane protein